jgi:hypothetical protein
LVTKLFVGNLPDDASQAMLVLHGTDCDGRSLEVSKAEDRDRSGGGNRHGGSRRC